MSEVKLILTLYQIQNTQIYIASNNLVEAAGIAIEHGINKDEGLLGLGNVILTDVTITEHMGEALKREKEAVRQFDTMTKYIKTLETRCRNLEYHGKSIITSLETNNINIDKIKLHDSQSLSIRYSIDKMRENFTEG